MKAFAQDGSGNFFASTASEEFALLNQAEAEAPAALKSAVAGVAANYQPGTTENAVTVAQDLQTVEMWIGKKGNCPGATFYGTPPSLQ